MCYFNPHEGWEMADYFINYLQLGICVDQPKKENEIKLYIHFVLKQIYTHYTQTHTHTHILKFLLRSLVIYVHIIFA